MQASKTIYFADYPSSGRTKSGLTIPFSSEDGALYELVRPLSSHAMRTLIGFDHYAEIESAASAENTPIATFVRKLLRQYSGPVCGDPEREFFRIQSTFRGGRGSPLHEWYPYLEGYSPEFVSNVLDTFAPDARDILDPFCGSGTTALVAALRGGNGFYAEINPVCQYVIEAKALALTLSHKERGRVADSLRSVRDDSQKLIRQHQPDKDLAACFSSTFGERRPFFDDTTYDTILRVRAFADRLERDDPVVARFFVVAVLRCLVPCSLLIRRGDLRFMTAKERERGIPDFTDELRNSLDLISSDLMDSVAAAGRTQFVAADARTLHTHLPGKVDAVVTSPPYLNGTNYFRNTKIELWFLRCLRSKSDLRLFRDGAITSGINDVTVGKLRNARSASVGCFKSSALSEALSDLSEKAYDIRIPAMVENYFLDMNDVIATLQTFLINDGVMAIDLGDSIYSGVHVKTHEIISELMQSHGFKPENSIVLRERQSRDGTRLTQTLQVFRAKGQRAGAKNRKVSVRLKNWQTFRQELPHQSGEMARRNWGHSWHSMCSYQGKLKPAIARCLVDALMPNGPGRMLDPFSGVGTIPFEARLRGHQAFGFDISPAAVAISRAKLETIEWEQVDCVLEKLARRIKAERKKKRSTDSLCAIRFNGPLPSYFHQDTLREVVAARQFFLENEPENGPAALVFSCLLHILHGNRPYALTRRSHPITPFAPTGPTEYRSLMERLDQKVNRCRADAGSVPDVAGSSFFQDITATWPEEVNKLDAIITSPPFFDSTRFHTANWMRLWFAGWEAEDFQRKPADFVDERQKVSFAIYEDIFRQANERLVPGGVFAIHVGKSTKCDMAAALQQIGERYLRLADWFSESVEHCESHGIRDKGTVTHHQYLLFEKSAT